MLRLRRPSTLVETFALARACEARGEKTPEIIVPTRQSIALPSVSSPNPFPSPQITTPPLLTKSSPMPSTPSKTLSTPPPAPVSSDSLTPIVPPSIPTPDPSTYSPFNQSPTVQIYPSTRPSTNPPPLKPIIFSSSLPPILTSAIFSPDPISISHPLPDPPFLQIYRPPNQPSPEPPPDKLGQGLAEPRVLGESASMLKSGNAGEIGKERTSSGHGGNTEEPETVVVSSRTGARSQPFRALLGIVRAIASGSISECRIGSQESVVYCHVDLGRMNPDSDLIVKRNDELGPKPNPNRSSRIPPSLILNVKRGPANLFKRRYDTMDCYENVKRVVKYGCDVMGLGKAPHPLSIVIEAMKNRRHWVMMAKGKKDAANGFFEGMEMQGIEIVVVTSNIQQSGWMRMKKIDYAREVFDEMPERKIVLRNTMSGDLVELESYMESLGLFLVMWKEIPTIVSQLFASVIRASVGLDEVLIGNQLATSVAKWDLYEQIHVSCTLIDMYSFSEMGGIRQLHHRMSDPDVVSSTSLISGYTSSGCNCSDESLIPNQFKSMNINDSACASIMDSTLCAKCSPEMQIDFGCYAEVCFKAIGESVYYRITINEPNLMLKFGCLTGRYPPGRCSQPIGNCVLGNQTLEPYIAAHNALLSRTTAVDIYKWKYQMNQGGLIGIVINCKWNVSEDYMATQRAFAFDIGWILDPIIFGEYPTEKREISGSKLPKFTSQERRKLWHKIDFMGDNHYAPHYVQDYIIPDVVTNNVLLSSWVKVKKIGVVGARDVFSETTAKGVEPNTCILKNFLATILLVFKVVILFSYRDLAQAIVLGGRDSSDQTVYVLDQICAWECEMLLRMKQQGGLEKEAIVSPEQNIPITMVTDLEWQTEGAGSFSQFLELCCTFYKGLDMKKGQPEAIRPEIERDRGGPPTSQLNPIKTVRKPRVDPWLYKNYEFADAENPYSPTPQRQTVFSSLLVVDEEHKNARNATSNFQLVEGSYSLRFLKVTVNMDPTEHVVLLEGNREIAEVSTWEFFAFCKQFMNHHLEDKVDLKGEGVDTTFTIALGSLITSQTTEAQRHIEVPSDLVVSLNISWIDSLVNLVNCYK